MFKGRSIYIRAIRDIPAGTMISISYIDMTYSTIQRKNLLKAKYGFSCGCSRCKKELNQDSHKSGIMCTCKNGFYVMGTKKCSSCKKELDYSDWKRNNELIDKIDNEILFAKSLEAKIQYEGALQSYHKAWELSKQLFYRYNIRNIPLLENIVWTYIQLGNFKEAHPYCVELLEITRQSLPYFTSFCAITEYKLAKIELNIGNNESAIKMLMHAYKILQLTHAEYPSFLNQLRDTIDSYSAELEDNEPHLQIADDNLT